MDAACKVVEAMVVRVAAAGAAGVAVVEQVWVMWKQAGSGCVGEGKGEAD